MWHSKTTNIGYPTLQQFMGPMYSDQCRIVCGSRTEFTYAGLDENGFCFCGDGSTPFDPGFCTGTNVVLYPDGSCRDMKDNQVQVRAYISSSFFSV